MLRYSSKVACALGLCLVCLIVGTTLVAEPQVALTAGDSAQVARLVAESIEANHISQAAIDDSISAKLIEEYIKQLDPQKLYFLAADVEGFRKYRNELDDLVKAGNLEFATLVFDAYLARLKVQIELAHRLIDAPHDFTVDESMPIDAKDIPWAKTPEELDDRWRKRIKYDLLMTRLEKTPAVASKAPPGLVPPKKPEGPAKNEEEGRTRLHKRYRTIYDTIRKTEYDEVVEMFLTALCTAFDPHSSYMSPRTRNEFQIAMGLSLEGIGAALKVEDGYTVVAQIVPGGAAATDGRLKVNDKIVAVGNNSADFVDVVEMKLSKVVDMIRGKSGTRVRLKVMSAESNEIKVYELVRQKVELKSSEVKGEIIDVGSRITGARGRIGVINVPSFYRDFTGAESGDDDFKSTARDMRKVIREFQAKGGVDAMIVDLRYNGGGALSEAIDVSGLFIDEGPVVQVKTQKGKSKALYDEEPGVEFDKPLIVVTNRLSASASEIFAGVIHDYGRGLIVGDRTTHGKGTVQSVMSVGKPLLSIIKPQDLGALKLTIQQFYRVNGESTQNLGVSSDVVLPSLLDNMDLGESFLDNAMPFDQIPVIKYPKMGRVNPEMVASLRSASQKRVAADSEFQKVERDIEKYLARKLRKSVSLNEEELRKERVDEEQKTRDKADSSDDMTEGPIFPVNSYNNELLSITVDYLTQLREAKTARK
jgi:carboxyl-terminal processing protease